MVEFLLICAILIAALWIISRKRATKRKRYNGDVDYTLNEYIGIKTRGNDNFPNILMYLKFIDKFYQNGREPQICAFAIAAKYLEYIQDRNPNEYYDTFIKFNMYGFDLRSQGVLSEEMFQEFMNIAIGADALKADISPSPTGTSP